ncbi:UNVERIFIED_CONTAM: hypothetical protein GTU68_040883 [Idotea baltica]|nr:hypothetical protein [Idotea baltica]
MQTLFVREHNRIADELAQRDPQLSDEQLYQQARAIVTAELQAITYNEFLPALLGEDAISEYEGYDSSVDSSISNLFSTAAYRLGHSLLSSELQLIDGEGNVEELALQNAFFSPDIVSENGIDSILRGAATQTSQELDAQIIDDVRNFLFGPPGSGGFDLASLNIQRGRDHGLPSYNQARIDLGLTPATTFADISSDPDVQARLASVYDSVDDVDVWVGGLAEDHVEGSSTGELLRTVLVDQFSRIRDGDRLWYENNFSGEQLRRLDNTTLADVIERNTDVEGLQENVFFVEGREVGLNDEVVLFDADTGRFSIGKSDGEHFELVAGPRWSKDAGFELFDGDFNGDGRLDVAGFNDAGQWYVALADGESFQTDYFGRWSATAGWSDIRVGDFNGDGNDDVVGRTASGQLWIGQSDGDSFTNTYGGRWNTTGWTDVLVGDFDGNGTDDLAGRQATGEWYVANGTDGRFQTSYAGRWSGSAGWQDVVVGDFNGDQQDDFAGRTASGQWWIGEIHNGRLQSNYAGRWSSNGWDSVMVGDLDGDQRDDLIGITQRGEIYVNHTTPDGNSRRTVVDVGTRPIIPDVALYGDFTTMDATDIAPVWTRMVTG